MESFRPCVYSAVDESGRLEKRRPEVKCNKDCSRCGWNPIEQKWRLEKGRFVKNAVVVIRHYAGEEDQEGMPVVYTGLRQLVFPKPKIKRGKYVRKL